MDFIIIYIMILIFHSLQSNQVYITCIVDDLSALGGAWKIQVMLSL